MSTPQTVAKRPPDRIRAGDKYPGVWYREGADGKRHYIIGYRDSAGRQRWKHVAGGLREAVALREELRSKMRRGERVAPSRATFAEVADAWLDAQTQLRDRTREMYRINLTNHGKRKLGRIRISDVTEDDVAALIADMRDRGYSPYTIRAVLVPVGRVLGHAARRGMIAANPISKLERGERPATVRREMRVLSRDEIGKLLDKAGNYRPLLATAILSGLRLGELLGLRWQDVDFEAELVHVRNALDRNGKLGPPKTAQAVRDVVLAPALAAILREHRVRSSWSHRLDFVFASGVGTPLHYRNVSRRGLDVAMEAAGLAQPRPKGKRQAKAGLRGPQRPAGDVEQARFRFHDCRHTFASLLISKGLDVVFVSRQLGHASPDITLRVYSHLWDRARHADEARNALDGVLDEVTQEVASGRNGAQNGGAPEGAEVVALQGKRG